MNNEWEAQTLGKAFTTVTGNTPPKNNAGFYGNFMPLVKPPELCDLPFDSAADGLSEAGSAVARTAPPESILVSCIGNLGKIGFNTVPVAFNQQINAILPDNAKAVPEFMFYQALSSGFREQLGALASGTTVSIVNKSKFNSIKIVLPPLQEQRRIVGILDEAFEGIAAAKANAEKNLQNARAIFEGYLQSVLRKHDSGWEKKPLISLCSLFVDSAHRTPTYQVEGIPALRPRDVVNGKLILTEAARVSEDEYDIQSKRHRPAPGDIVYSRELSYGWAVMVPESPRVCLSQGMCLFRPAPNLDSTFLLYVLNSPVGREQALRAAVGAAHPHINLGDIKGYQIPFPPSAEQKRITRQLDAVVAETQHLESIYRRKLAALDALKKSLLHQAFAGELTRSARKPVVIPFPIQIPNVSATDLHAGILAMAYDLHEENGRQNFFGHVKAEKIAHMVEASLGIDLGRSPVKDAAGPSDFPHLFRVEYRATKKNYFDFKRVNGAAYRVHKLPGFQRLVDETRTVLGDRRDEVERLLQWMLPMNTQHAEIVATVFAAWNNLLLEGKLPTDKQIVFEARENWHPRKLEIDRHKFFEVMQQLRDESRVPEGKGNRVECKGKVR